MSATNRGSNRHEYDNYPTPDWCVHRMIESINPLGEGWGLNWLEPCAGEGNIIRAVNSVCNGISWQSCDIRKECMDKLISVSRHACCDDFLKTDWVWDEPIDVVITNPPFKVALEIIEKCFEIADDILILQRLNFLGSAKRHEFFEDSMPDVYVLPDRPCFTGDGKTDAETYAWFHWSKNLNNDQRMIKILDTTSVEERRKYYGS